RGLESALGARVVEGATRRRGGEARHGRPVLPARRRGAGGGTRRAPGGRGAAVVARGGAWPREPLACSALSLVLVNPRVAASTAEIYGGVAAAMYSNGARARRMSLALKSR